MSITTSGPGFQNPANMPWGPPQQYGTFNTNLPDANVETRHIGIFGGQLPVHTKGYGVDLDGNGRYDRGRDGVLAFDFNHDGKISRKEVSTSNDALKAFGGTNDLNGDGDVSFKEAIRAKVLREGMKDKDTNGDGRLSQDELTAAGGKVLVDHNRNGEFGTAETYSPSNFPAPGFERGSVDMVDPRNNYSAVSHWRYNGWYGPAY